MLKIICLIQNVLRGLTLVAVAGRYDLLMLQKIPVLYLICADVNKATCRVQANNTAIIINKGMCCPCSEFS